jgi:hypothetical protein
MARRPNLAAVDLKDDGRQAEERDDGKTAQTMRLPSEVQVCISDLCTQMYAPSL